MTSYVKKCEKQKGQRVSHFDTDPKTEFIFAFCFCGAI